MASVESFPLRKLNIHEKIELTIADRKLYEEFYDDTEAQFVECVSQVKKDPHFKLLNKLPAEITDSEFGLLADCFEKLTDGILILLAKLSREVCDRPKVTIKFLRHIEEYIDSIEIPEEWTDWQLEKTENAHDIGLSLPRAEKIKEVQKFVDASDNEAAAIFYVTLTSNLALQITKFHKNNAKLYFGYHFMNLDTLVTLEGQAYKKTDLLVNPNDPKFNETERKKIESELQLLRWFNDIIIEFEYTEQGSKLFPRMAAYFLKEIGNIQEIFAQMDELKLFPFIFGTNGTHCVGLTSSGISEISSDLFKCLKFEQPDSLPLDNKEIMKFLHTKGFRLFALHKK